MLEIIKLNKKDFPCLKPIFIGCKSNFLFSGRAISENRFNEYMLSGLKKEEEVLAAKEGRNILGYASLKELPWDSAHFGMKMASMNIETLAKNRNKNKEAAFLLVKAVRGAAERRKIKHLSVKINPARIEGIKTLEKNEFYFTASIISYVLDLKKAGFKYCDIDLSDIDDAKKSDLKALKKIALSSFGDRKAWTDRFHSDRHLMFGQGSRYGFGEKNPKRAGRFYKC